MLWKLSLTGIKSRLRDYLVLFSGLVMASAILHVWINGKQRSFWKVIRSLRLQLSFSDSVLFTRDHHIRLYFICKFLLMTMRQKTMQCLWCWEQRQKIAQMIFWNILSRDRSYFSGFSCRCRIDKYRPPIISGSVRSQYFAFYTFSIHGLLITVCFAVCFISCCCQCFSIVKTDFSIDSCGSDTNKNQAA